MFTGIIEETGTIISLKRGKSSVVLEIGADKVLEGSLPGDSISTNGVCLTVTETAAGRFKADAMPETVERTTLAQLKPGDKVNLERALTLTSRLGGHLVSGHVDGIGRVADLQREDNAVRITVAAPSSILRYVATKGSVAVDGASLTVVYADAEVFSVGIIPHTSGHTTLSSLRVGDTVNVEVDMLARYMEKLLKPDGDKPLMDFLESLEF